MSGAYVVKDVRQAFRERLRRGEIVPGGSRDADTIEILGAQFVADEPTIFGSPSPGYERRELEWYESQSLNVNDIPPPVPEIWKRVATPDGRINSNYGWMIHSKENGSQYESCLRKLVEDREFCGRQACMIYQRPSMQTDWDRDGMHDFVCTDAVHCFVRLNPATGKPILLYLVFMRSNDAVFGYKNDLAWHRHVRDALHRDVVRRDIHFAGLEVGPILWNAASLHVYSRHFHLVDPPREIEEVSL